MIKGFGDKIRTFFARFGYTCDGCGAETFDYPKHRLCRECETALVRNGEKVCEKCGRKTRSKGVCLACKGELPHFTRGYSPFVYKDLVASYINRLKNGDRYLANFLGEEMAKYYLSVGAEKDVLITCVPLSDDRLRTRGYNQAEELAKTVAKVLNVEFDSEILIKSREDFSQKHLSAKERRENVMGAYRVVKRKEVKGKTLLLIDDIMTTGATGSECARVLKNAGAKDVLFLAVASLEERI
jgi:ComF family protein